MPHYGYMVVEGPHDIEFIARLLRPLGFRRIQFLQDLDPFWKHGNLIPNKFPYNDDLLKRVPVPMFFQNATHSIAIHSANGYTRLAETIQETLISLDTPAAIESIGVVLDADDRETVERRFRSLTEALWEKNPALIFPDEPGQVRNDYPATGIFILPDDHSTGTLEDILLDAAQVNYPNLASAAAQYIQTINQGELNREDLEEFNKPAGSRKAQVGSMASILKPGKAIQVSIQDNRWIEGAAFDLPGIQVISAFLNQLFRL
jgi:hypothetical protein